MTKWKFPVQPSVGGIRGRAAVGAFCGVFLLAGLAFGYAFVVRPVANIVAATGWQPTTCQIVSSAVRAHSDNDGSTYSVDVRYRYSVGGHSYWGDRYKFITGSSSGYRGKAAIVNALPPGSTTPCFYDPATPTESVIDRGPTLELLYGLIPLLFILIGGAGVGAAIFGDFTRSFGMKTPGFSKAITLQRTTLKPAQSRRVRFIAMTLIAIFWNSIVALFIAKFFGAAQASGFELKDLFLLPFVAVGVVLLVVAVRFGLGLRNPQATIVVSTPAVAAGGEVMIDWSIDGSIKRMTRLTIDLEGREEATYRRGTTTLTDRNVFATIPVTSQARGDLSRTGTAKITIPAGAMHSFDAPHNKIIWVLHVRGEIPHWPDCDDEYPLIVAPRNA